MVNTTSNTFSVKTTGIDADFSERLRTLLKAIGYLVLGCLLLGAGTAFAQAGGLPAPTGLCRFADFLKQVIGAGAIIAILLLVINSFFAKSSVIGDIIIYVIIGCVIAVSATALINLTGLTATC